MSDITRYLLNIISKYYSIQYNELEYAYNKLLSFDRLLEAIEYSMKNNLKLSVYAHELRNKLKDGR